MDAALVQALVVKLLLAAQGLSGYAAPGAPPSVAFLPQGELAQRACDGPCAVYGWFPPGRTIYLDDRLDPLSDLRARGILLHELVHFLQQENGAFGGPQSCRTWLDKEHEAFDVERRWLMEQPRPRAAAVRPGAWAPRVPLKVFCRDEPASAAQAGEARSTAARVAR